MARAWGTSSSERPRPTREHSSPWPGVKGVPGRVRREQPSATSMRSAGESTSSQADDGVEANDFQDPVEDQEEQESRQDEWSNQEWDSWSSGWWNYQSWSWGRRHGSWEEPDTSGASTSCLKSFLTSSKAGISSWAQAWT